MKFASIRATCLALFALVSAPAFAQLSVDVTDESGNDLNIAVPVMPTPQVIDTPAGTTEALGRQVAEVCAARVCSSPRDRPESARSRCPK
jgi:TolB protein